MFVTATSACTQAVCAAWPDLYASCDSCWLCVAAVAEHAVVHIGYTLITYELVRTGIADASEQTAATLFVCMLLWSLQHC
jgi:hypothetical protein